MSNFSIRDLTIQPSHISEVGLTPIFNADQLYGTLIRSDITGASEGNVLIFEGTGWTYSSSLNNSTIAIGTDAGETNQGTGAIAIGVSAGEFNQGTASIAIGVLAGQTSQGTGSVAIGHLAGAQNQFNNGIAIGTSAGQTSQGNSSIAIGYYSGRTRQGDSCVAIGRLAGEISQGVASIAVGFQTGRTQQGDSCIAVGTFAGEISQGTGSIAIGYQVGNINQGTGCVAIGLQAGQTNQGSNSIAIGTLSGDINQANNSIVISALGTSLGNPSANSCRIAPLRNAAIGTNSHVVGWDTLTKELFYENGKTFIINHPQDDDKYLVHACLEGPEVGVYYRGNSVVTDGRCEVSIPNYTSNFTDFTVHITPIYNGNNVRVLNATEVENGVFTVHGEDGPFSWLVHGKRGSITVEPSKDSVNVMGDGPYKWIQ